MAHQSMAPFSQGDPASDATCRDSFGVQFGHESSVCVFCIEQKVSNFFVTLITPNWCLYERLRWERHGRYLTNGTENFGKSPSFVEKLC